MDDKLLRADILAFLGEYNVMSLATRDAGGAPHAANLMFANDGFILYWLSDQNSRHSRHIEAAPQVAATIAPDYADFKDIKGLQIAGTAERVAGPLPSAHGVKLLAARYHFLGQFLEGPSGLMRRMAKAALYRLDPLTVTLVDNAKGFGHKETIELGP
jgi:hypothetical protein